MFNNSSKTPARKLSEKQICDAIELGHNTYPKLKEFLDVGHSCVRDSVVRYKLTHLLKVKPNPRDALFESLGKQYEELKRIKKIEDIKLRDFKSVNGKFVNQVVLKDWLRLNAKEILDNQPFRNEPTK